MKMALRAVAMLATVVAGAAVLYWAVLSAPAGGRYPWGNDAWGHLIKAEYLGDAIASGRVYPDVFPGWYSGVQLFRYYAPLPYYALAALMMAGLDPFTAHAYYLYLGALVAAASFLLFGRRVGYAAALVGGLLFAASPDNLRVAFDEGNLPRVLSTALLPLLLYLVLQLLDGKHPRLLPPLTAVVACLLVLSHAMLAAIALLCLGILAGVYWALGGTDGRGFARAAFGLGSGLLLSGWWLLPSLSGGITDLNGASMAESSIPVPLLSLFDPATRARNPENFYFGLGVGVSAIVVALSWRRIGPLARSLLLVGCLGTVVMTTELSPVVNSLPFHHLFWPIRFTSFATLALVLAPAVAWRDLIGNRWHRAALVAGLLLALLDVSGSTYLVRLGPPKPGVVAAAEALRASTGWRVAALEGSRLGSSPSYLLTRVGGREQLYGWGYQGARTASTIASINYAMEHGRVPYAIDRLNEMGVDDALLMDDVPWSEEVATGLAGEGFSLATSTDGVSLYHRDGSPRAQQLAGAVLGIGQGAQNFAQLFPAVVPGGSNYVDDYAPAYLSGFGTVILSRASWHDRARAESVVREFARAGGNVVIDLTGSPTGVLSGQAEFLGVRAEPVQLGGSVSLDGDGGRVDLLPFPDDEPWQAHVLQGLDHATLTFPFMGLQAAAAGYRDLGSSRVWFVGLNLPFHALLTGDAASTGILARILGVREGQPAGRIQIPLDDYHADEQGYHLSLDLARGGELLVPVAALDGMVVRLDGTQVDTTALDDLLAFSAPPGHHEVEISVRQTPVYRLGAAASGTALILLALYLFAPGALFAFTARGSLESCPSVR